MPLCCQLSSVMRCREGRDDVKKSGSQLIVFVNDTEVTRHAYNMIIMYEGPEKHAIIAIYEALTPG
jgi:hypothetical protein